MNEYTNEQEEQKDACLEKNTGEKYIDMSVRHGNRLDHQLQYVDYDILQ